MINLYIRGRLGNQMFQYACVKAYAKKWDEEVNICFTCDKNQLSFENINGINIVDKINVSLKQKAILMFFCIIRRIFSNNNKLKQQKIEIKMQSFLNHFGIYWFTRGYYNFKKSKVKNKIFIGYFESEKYFSIMGQDIKKDFEINLNLSVDNNLFLQKINSTNSVAISIRRGDFVDVNNIVCDLKYYYKAIKVIERKIKNPVYFVFSDDIDWVKKNINLSDKKVFYENKNNKVLETLLLMSSCKNFIISNSTFHWWAQYLSKNDKKVVIAPKKWRKYDIKLDIHQDDWILIDN